MCPHAGMTATHRYLDAKSLLNEARTLIKRSSRDNKMIQIAGGHGQPFI